MKILLGTKPISFKAHFYNVQVRPVTKSISIETDNKPDLGSEPILISGKSNEMPMTKTNLGYATDYIPFYKIDTLKYRIHYKDTNNTDTKNGRDYQINPEKLFKKALIEDKKCHNQPLEIVLSKGKLSGKLIDIDKYNTPNGFDIERFEKEIGDSQKPVIILSKDIFGSMGIMALHERYCRLNNKEFENIFRGFICTDLQTDALGHSGSSIRNTTDMSAILLDEDKIDALKKLDGKYIDASTQSGFLEFNESSKDNIEQVKGTSVKIEIPIMKHVENLIELKDYEVDTVGPKAYKLKLMQDLVDKGKLDVIIPDSFVVPNGHIEKMYRANKDWNNRQEKEYKSCVENNKTYYALQEALTCIVQFEKDGISQTEDIERMLKKKGWEDKTLMIRSSFNGEDIPGYSAAGLYESYSAKGLENIIESIYFVNASKWTEKAYTSRMLNNIPHDDIKASVIVQEKIDNPDYKFTIYTKTPNTDNNTAYMEMHSKDSVVNIMRDPYRIEYDKKTKNLNVLSTERTVSDFKFNENGEMVDSSINNDKLAENKKEMYPLLKKVMENALLLEKEFNAPQDIEGGIKDGKIYFWQTRNIVK